MHLQSKWGAFIFFVSLLFDVVDEMILWSIFLEFWILYSKTFDKALRNTKGNPLIKQYQSYMPFSSLCMMIDVMNNILFDFCRLFNFSIHRLRSKDMLGIFERNASKNVIAFTHSFHYLVWCLDLSFWYNSPKTIYIVTYIFCVIHILA